MINTNICQLSMEASPNMDMKRICLNQIEEAKKHKWILGQKLGYDPGDKAIEDWVNNYAKAYREEYKACFNELKIKVYNSIKNKLTQKYPSISEDDIQGISNMVIDEFTLIWTKECAMNEGDEHLKEI